MLIEEALLSVVVVLGGDEIGLRLADVRRRVAEVGRVDEREHVALLHALAERRVDARDSTGDRRVDVGDARVVEGDLAARHDRVVDVLLFDRSDLDLRVAHLRVGQPRLAGRRLGARGLVRVTTRERAGREQAESERRAKSRHGFSQRS